MTTATAGGTVAAPASTRASRSARQSAVYYVLLTFGPLTDKELVARYDALRQYVGQPGGIAQSPSGLRSRRAELVRMGYVEADLDDEDLPVRREHSQVWRAV